ncbi:hypothetical protein IEO21_07777 [Rhodonia placenta]|uniref:Uncharacterized protein n=1 Tax=Rhodonia placenta TaxID=104341 RepID=A0A8H7NXI7_9APHY|nr:hypothetical protein IEO21_07777 [Postia placenta]
MLPDAAATADTLPTPSPPRSPPLPPPQLHWNLADEVQVADLAPSAQEQGVATVAQALLDWLDSASATSEDALEERSHNGDSDNDEPCCPHEEMSRKSTQSVLMPFTQLILADDEPHFSVPEPPRKRARHTSGHVENSAIWFPWHDKILDLFLWLLRVNGVDDLPSVKTMQSLNAALQRMCGIDTIPYKGALGHNYHVNSLAQIIAQEMANPRVRPHLHFYPEDRGERPLAEARQAARWLHEMPNELLTPMARVRNQDYYIYEPAMLVNGVGTEIEIAETMLIKNFPQLRADAGHLYDIPDPARIHDCRNVKTGATAEWTLTNPVIGNQWRALAKGHRAVSFAMWLYCDDTSGNLSKKWNAHNSFLFTAAGLPRVEVQKEYNVHFLSTSNLAPPLEMLDGVVEQLAQAQANGIWAWDSSLNDPILVIPFVLAMLGDNPMQSEFACHIGLQGKLFCRACWARGKDPADDADTGFVNAPDLSQAESVASDLDSDVSEVSGRSGSDAHWSVDPPTGPSTIKKKSKRPRKRVLEGMAAMIRRVTDFIKMRTHTGIKDTFQLHFLDKLFDSHKNRRNDATKQSALDHAVASLPPDIISPVWRIKGLDPHQDTPVEILHVVLLGFVKYLWRDVIQNQLKGKEDKKNLVATRLSDLDVSGLGISTLAGPTLVQYSGSLTGRDFRAIAQTALFVLYDMVTPDCLETWKALSKLVPLLWQPEIPDLKSHLDLLDKEIRHFLLCAARWTIRWFNKPKFHIILHLVEHIRRFGPAILFATEAFESFNAAPSRDIAHAFAQGNRIRHLVSGGLFCFGEEEAGAECGPMSVADSWHSIGPGPRSLVEGDGSATVLRYLGLENKSPPLYGKKLPNSLSDSQLVKIKTNKKVYLLNGDVCMPGIFVIVRDPRRPMQTYIACVREIIQIKGSPAELTGRPDGLLIQSARSQGAAEHYAMPRLQMVDEWGLVRLNVCML